MNQKPSESQGASASSPPATGFQRLHPATLWVPLLTRIGGYFAGLVPLAIFVGFRTAVMVGAALLLAGALAPVIRYAAFQFRLEEDALHIRHGLLWIQERRIPWRRVQRVEIVQGPIHRFMGVARVVIRTAGEEEQEAELDVVSRALAVRIQEAATRQQPRSGEPAAPEEPESIEQPLLQLSWGELLLGGLSSRLASTLVALVGVVAYFGAVTAVGGALAKFAFPQPMEMIWNAPIARLFRGTPAEPWLRLLLEDTLAKSVLLVLGGLAFAVAQFAVRYGGYELSRKQGTLCWSFGLLRRRTQSLAPDRVQALKVEQSWLRRRLGLADLWVDSAGEHREAEEEKKREPFVPVIAWRRLPVLLAEILGPEVTVDPVWEPVSPQAVRRRVRVRWLVLLLAGVLLWRPFGWFVLSLLPAFPLVPWWVRLWYRHFGYALEPAYLVTRSGWFHRRILFVPYHNIQNVEYRQSPFDRRWNMASIRVDIAGQTNTGGGPTIRYLPAERARELAREITLLAAGRAACAGTSRPAQEPDACSGLSPELA
ncbi:MAG: hypothetical protein Kow00109_07350 [Acidobacteriota bacterium]